jgi:hypothetical protein
MSSAKQPYAVAGASEAEVCFVLRFIQAQQAKPVGPIQGQQLQLQGPLRTVTTAAAHLPTGMRRMTGSQMSHAYAAPAALRSSGTSKWCCSRSRVAHIRSDREAAARSPLGLPCQSLQRLSRAVVAVAAAGLAAVAVAPGRVAGVSQNVACQHPTLMMKPCWQQVRQCRTMQGIL